MPLIPSIALLSAPSLVLMLHHLFLAQSITLLPAPSAASLLAPCPDTYLVPQVLQLLGGLGGEWLAFQQCMLDSEVMLKRHKEKFKTGLIHSADDFKKKAQVLLQDFGAKGRQWERSWGPAAAPSLSGWQCQAWLVDLVEPWALSELGRKPGV